jgi:peptide-methionine (S)-S-oxide reductase
MGWPWRNDPADRDTTQRPPIAPGTAPDGLVPATFAAGCFWGVEELFRGVSGVAEVISGYTGGSVERPTYPEVCSGRTGHAEAVWLAFDPDRVTYETLLETFWRHHDPTTPNRQGPDVGTQYRSAIFTHGDDQWQQAVASRDAVQARFRRPIVTEIVSAAVFWPAEEYHQRYVARTGRGGCHVANW